jgi:hypothetical protein
VSLLPHLLLLLLPHLLLLLLALLLLLLLVHVQKPHAVCSAVHGVRWQLLLLLLLQGCCT